MATTAAVISLNARNRLTSSFFASESELVPVPVPVQISSKNHLTVVAQKSSNLNGNSPSRNRAQIRAIKALKTHVHTPTTTTIQQEDEEEEREEEMVLLLKSMLENQWKLPFDFDRLDSVKLTPTTETQKETKKDEVIRSGTTPRERRSINRRKYFKGATTTTRQKQYTVSPDLLQMRRKGGYLRKGILGRDLLSHDKVVRLSKKIKDGLLLEKHKQRLEEKLGTEPTEEQLARYLKISYQELSTRFLESSLAKEKLLMSNVRLVKSIALKYDNMGVDMDDLIQGGLVGLLKGIEKFDPNKGFRFSTYVYWWIRQGVSRTFVENSGLVRLPSYMHERLGLIKNAKFTLQQEGITPTIEKIAETLNISQKKVRNATEVYSKVFSLDREIFPTLGGQSGNTLHNYIQDKNPESDPWYAFQQWHLKEEVNKLLNTVLNKREREIICLYHGVGSDSISWEDIGKKFGLSRERVRQVGLVAMEKLKQAAKQKELDAFLMEF
ncbi:hypothetical protein LUZ60_011637 [Juncus effusus]|nr:hypothetical protein LUZ60_011637 [Juncus effusus]